MSSHGFDAGRSRLRRISGPHPIAAVRRRSARLAAALAFATTTGLLAQDSGRPQTDLQDETEAAIRAVCAGLAALNAEGALVGLQTELFRRCNEMVETANELDGFTDPDRIDASLGLTSGELAAAWQQLTGEEVAAQGSLGTEVSDAQLDNLGSRMAALRRGAAGLSAGGLGFSLGGGVLGLDDLGLRPATVSSLLQTGADPAATGEPGRWGGFLNGTVGFGDKDGTGREDPFDLETSGLTLGFDYRFSESFVAGIAFGSSSVDADLLATSSGTVSGGEVDADGTSVALYFTAWGEKGYLDGSVVVGEDEYEIARRIVYTSRTSRASQDRVAKSETDGSRTTWSLGAGYEGGSGPWSYGPYVRLTGLEIDIDGYAEADAGAAELALVVGDQSIDSLVSVVGFEFTRAMSLSSGVVVVQGSADWNHEFEDDPRTIEGSYKFDPNGFAFNVLTDEPDRDYYLASLGLVGVFPRGWQLFVNVDSIFGLENLDYTQLTAGIRFGA